MLKLIFALIAVAVAVPAGGLLAGVDRRLTARLQSRQGAAAAPALLRRPEAFSGKAPLRDQPVAHLLVLRLSHGFGHCPAHVRSCRATCCCFFGGRVLRHDGRRGVQGGRRAFRRLALQQRGRAARTAPDARLRAAGHPHLRGHVRRHRQLHDLRHLRARRAAAAAPAVPVHRARLRADHQARQVALRHRLLSPRASGNRARRADRLFRPPVALLEISHWLDVILLLGLCACSGTPASRAWSSCSC